MIFSDLPSPAEAPSQTAISAMGFAQAGNRYPPRIKCGASFFGIMLYCFLLASALTSAKAFEATSMASRMSGTPT